MREEKEDFKEETTLELEMLVCATGIGATGIEVMVLDSFSFEDGGLNKKKCW